MRFALYRLNDFNEPIWQKLDFEENARKIIFKDSEDPVFFPNISIMIIGSIEHTFDLHYVSETEFYDPLSFNSRVLQ